MAPSGENASDWVLQRYAGLVRQRRSKNFQQNLGLLVHIDGDNHGVLARKQALDARLAAVPVAPRGVGEPVAVFVPTWSIETWLMHLTGLATPPETVRLKRTPDPTYRLQLRQIEEREADVIRAAVGCWDTFAEAPPSLADARAEASRIGMP